MKVYRSTIAGTASLLACLALFLYFGAQADAAMDKTGVGDLEAWRVYSWRSGAAFWAGTVIWAALIAWGLRSKKPERGQLFGVCGLAPLIFFAVLALNVVA